MTAGTAIVPVMDAIAKYLGQSISPLQITWGRFFFQFLILACVILLIRSPKLLWPKQIRIHAIRGTLLAFATLCFFWSLQYLPLADTIAIFFVEPMILTLMSAFFLGEHVGWHRRIAVVTGFAGALLIIRPGSEAFHIASVLPLIAATLYASYLTVTRAHSQTDHPLTMQFASGFSAAILLSLALLLAAQWPESSFAPSYATSEQWMWMAVIGAIAAFGHLLVVMGIKRAPASLLAPFGYTEIVAATGLGWWVFAEWPNRYTWLGIVIIVGSGIYVYWREQKVVDYR